MDDGISAIIIILLTLAISLCIYIYTGDTGLFVVIFLISIILISLLIYTCLIVISTKWDKYKVKKEWEKLEEMKKIKTELFK